MAAIAVGVLVVTGLTTVALARRAASRTAITHLEEQAPTVRNQLRRLGSALRGRSTAGRPTAGVGQLLTAVLRVNDGTLLTVSDSGEITEGVTGLAESRAGVEAPTSARANPLPAGLSVTDFDADLLRSGETQTGTVGGRAFVAEPIRVGPLGTSVLVLTEKVDSAAIARARGFFLVGAALALLAAAIVSFVLARRLTRPLATMGATAGAIAAGDFTARVDLGDHPDDELADLARSLNGMAVELESARMTERQFLLSVSHDLRTPLTSIRGYAAALTDGTIPGSPEQARAGEVITAEADRLNRLVADLLDLARIDAHQFSLSPRPIDLAAAVRTAVEAFFPAAADLGIALSVDAPGTLAGTGDPDRLAQIVANLVENALKYAHDRIDVGLRDAGAGVLEIRVVDDGPGIEPGEEQRVFERLFVSRAAPGRSVGTGLGLAIVGELAGAMGGSAAVDPSGTGGATFLVRLPLRTGAS